VNDVELLRHVYRAIDFGELARIAPSVERDDVIVLFQKLRNLVELTDASCCEGDAEIKRGQVLIMHIDGASRGNPGKCAAGVAVYDNNGRLLCTFGRYLGEGTNNEAEYKALTLAAEWAHKKGAGRVVFRTDSELLHNQITGIYRVKAAHLRRLAVRAQRALAQLPAWSIEVVPRELNFEPDAAANEVLNKAAKQEKNGSPASKS